MKTWKGYNLLDLLLILVGIITITVTSIIFHSQWYIILNTILGLLCVFTQAKGKVITQFLGLGYFGFYTYISYTQKFYGEALIYLLIMIPMYLYGVIHWLANRDKKDNVVIVRSNLSKLEWLIAGMCILLITPIIYVILDLLNTSKVFISTLSFVSLLPSVYLLIRRCKWNQVAFLINDLIVPILWIFCRHILIPNSKPCSTVSGISQQNLYYFLPSVTRNEKTAFLKNLCKKRR